jgi:predicted lipoprotein with Yx(FWY)xxD motif
MTDQAHRLEASHRSPGHRRLRAARGAPAVIALGALAIVLAACGSSASPSTTTSASSGGGATTSSSAGGAGTPSGAATVKIATTSMGKVLVNATGMALYTYGPDHGGAQSTCTGTCIQAWPPLTVPAGTTPSAGPGVTGTLGTSKQSNGDLQVTYDGDLLYTFLSDTSPGQVTGNGVAGFSVVKVAAAASAPVTTTTAAKGGGYNY